MMLCVRGGIPRPIGNSPKILSRQILVRIILVGRWAFLSPRSHGGLFPDEGVVPLAQEVDLGDSRPMRRAVDRLPTGGDPGGAQQAPAKGQERLMGVARPAPSIRRASASKRLETARHARRCLGLGGRGSGRPPADRDCADRPAGRCPRSLCGPAGGSHRPSARGRAHTSAPAATVAGRGRQSWSAAMRIKVASCIRHGSC